jgi:thymidylate kinase
MSSVKLFILGLPGSGKSALARLISMYVKDNGWKATRFNDYTILLDMFRQDTARERFEPASPSGFNVRPGKFVVFDEALQLLEYQVGEYANAPNQPGKELIQIEFSRNDYDHAFYQFKPSFLENAFVLYLKTNIEICRSRIHQRVTNPQFDEDDFNVPDGIFESYYHSDNSSCIEDILESYGVGKAYRRVVDNNSTLENTFKEVKDFIDLILHTPFEEKTGHHQHFSEVLESLSSILWK